MQKFLAYVKQPYAEKGFIRATLDMCLRVLTALVWGYLMFILWNLLFDALVVFILFYYVLRGYVVGVHFAFCARLLRRRINRYVIFVLPACNVQTLHVFFRI